MTSFPDAPRRAAYLLLSILVALPAAGCQEPTAPPVVSDRDLLPEFPPQRLTFDPGDDRAPSWSGDGERIHYASAQPDAAPGASGTLMEVSLGNGLAVPWLGAGGGGQGAAYRFDHPSLAPGSGLRSWIEYRQLRDGVCHDVVAFCTDPGIDLRTPRLGELRLWLHDPAAAGGLEETSLRVGALASDPVYTVDSSWEPLDGYWTVDLLPGMLSWLNDGAPVYRPSPSPDGARVVFSDGVSLRVVRAADGMVQTLSLPHDAVEAAWSPTGGTIAFTALERGPAISATCHYRFGPNFLCGEVRTVRPALSSRIATVSPEGGSVRFLWEGSEPAWLPDGGSLVFRYENRLWLGDVDSGEARPLRGTEGARDPAVSPDGSRLAFARTGERGDFDIWWIRLRPEADFGPLGGGS